MDAAAFFHAHCAGNPAGDALCLPGWSVDDWRVLLSHTQPVQVASGDALMRLGEQERALYFVIDGALEVSQSTGRSDTLGTMFRELPGSVFGEVALFDGLPRSASVWAIKPTSLLKLTHDGLMAFNAAHMGLANDLLFALGRVLAFRVRRAKDRTRRLAFGEGG
jgi:CRP-like cAMP-binding protein